MTSEKGMLALGYLVVSATGSHCISVSATTRSEADEKLNASVRELQKLAGDDPMRGILVTKFGPGIFTAELSHDVPYGLTWERTHQSEHTSTISESMIANPASSR